jgi:hypothetical protein
MLHQAGRKEDAAGRWEELKNPAHEVPERNGKFSVPLPSEWNKKVPL